MSFEHQLMNPMLAGAAVALMCNTQGTGLSNLANDLLAGLLKEER